MKLEKKVHVNESIEQRRVWANYVLDYIGKADPNMHLEVDAFPLQMKYENIPSDVLIWKINEFDKDQLAGDLDLNDIADYEEIKSGKCDSEIASADRAAAP